MSKDATQQGVSGEDQELTEQERQEIEQKGRELATETRLSALDAIAANVDRERMEQDGMELEPRVPDEDPTKGNKPEKTDTTELTKEEEETVKLVVDGAEQVVPLSRVIDAGKRTLQKESAADKRLEEATNLRKMAEQFLANAKVGKTAPDTASGKTSQPLTDDEFKAKKKQWIQAIQYGEEAEAEKAFDEMMDFMGRGSTTATSKEEVSKLVEESLQDREQRDTEWKLASIRQKFISPKDQGGFDDLANSPYLMDEVRKLVDEKIQGGADGTQWDIYEDAGNTIRQRREEALNPKPGTHKVENLDGRRQRKAGIDNVSGVGAKSRSTTASEAEKSEEEFRQEALADIMKSRGQNR